MEFYTNCYAALKNDGILVAQGESPKFNEKAFVETHSPTLLSQTIPQPAQSPGPRVFTSLQSGVNPAVGVKLNAGGVKLNAGGVNENAGGVNPNTENAGVNPNTASPLVPYDPSSAGEGKTAEV